MGEPGADPADGHDSIDGLTAAEAARRLGVKRQTLYAYVSRGILHREVALDGRTSVFDPDEVERLRAGRRPTVEGELRTAISTALTRVDDRALLIRGRDLVALVGDGLSFPDIVDVLWDSPDDETWPMISGDKASVDGAGDTTTASPLDQMRVIVARNSAADPLRHELSPKNVRAVGRRLIGAMAGGLRPLHEGPDVTVAEQLWRRLAPTSATTAQLRSLDVALCLLVDHGLAASTFAARISASVRADPYAVTGTGLGALGGRLHGAASALVHELLTETERSGDVEASAGAARQRLGVFPGFGHTIYTVQDPRYSALMAAIDDAWAGDPRLASVARLREVIGERTEALPNIDLAIGTLTYLAHMREDAGELIFAVSRTAGWLAHAMEEYDEQPLRFRPKSRYTGLKPD